MKKKMLALAMVVAIGLSMAACGSTDSNTSQATAETVAASTEVTEAQMATDTQEVYHRLIEWGASDAEPWTLENLSGGSEDESTKLFAANIAVDGQLIGIDYDFMELKNSFSGIMLVAGVSCDMEEFEKRSSIALQCCTTEFSSEEAAEFVKRAAEEGLTFNDNWMLQFTEHEGIIYLYIIKR